MRAGLQTHTGRRQATRRSGYALRRPRVPWRRSFAPPLLPLDEALRDAEEMLAEFTVLYSNEALLRTAVRGSAAYQLPWIDAHLWAYAKHYGLSPLYPEDFQHDRLNGTVRVVDPFRA